MPIYQYCIYTIQMCKSHYLNSISTNKIMQATI